MLCCPSIWGLWPRSSGYCANAAIVASRTISPMVCPVASATCRSRARTSRGYLTLSVGLPRAIPITSRKSVPCVAHDVNDCPQFCRGGGVMPLICLSLADSLTIVSPPSTSLYWAAAPGSLRPAHRPAWLAASTLRGCLCDRGRYRGGPCSVRRRCWSPLAASGSRCHDAAPAPLCVLPSGTNKQPSAQYPPPASPSPVPSRAGEPSPKPLLQNGMRALRPRLNNALLWGPGGVRGLLLWSSQSSWSPPRLARPMRG